MSLSIAGRIRATVVLLSAALLYIFSMMFSVQANAAIMHYRIDINGNVFEEAPGIRRYGHNDNYTNNFWILDGNNNTIGLQGPNGFGQRPLSAPFHVNDIVDVHYTGTVNGGRIWVEATNGQHYAVNRNGQVEGQAPSYIRYYSIDDNTDNNWLRLDANANTISVDGNGGTGTRPLNAPFSVADIQDVTWTGFLGGIRQFWVTTATGSHRIDQNGNVTGSLPTGVRFYDYDDNYDFNYLVLDANANMFGVSGGGPNNFGMRALNTNLFTVADIQDVTMTGYGATGDIWVSVEVVPVPAAIWLFGSGLGLLGWLRRRTS